MNVVETDTSLFLYLVYGFLAVFVLFVVIIWIVYRGKKQRQSPGNSSYRKQQGNFDNNSLTHDHTTWGAGAAYNHQHMNNDMHHNNNYQTDKDHDGIPDQFDTHDNRFDNNMSNDSTNTFDNNSWSNDSGGNFDSGGSSGGSSDNNF